MIPFCSKEWEPRNDRREHAIDCYPSTRLSFLRPVQVSRHDDVIPRGLSTPPHLSSSLATEHENLPRGCESPVSATSKHSSSSSDSTISEDSKDSRNSTLGKRKRVKKESVMEEVSEREHLQKKMRRFRQLKIRRGFSDGWNRFKDNIYEHLEMHDERLQNLKKRRQSRPKILVVERVVVVGYKNGEPQTEVERVETVEDDSYPSYAAYRLGK